ncbi:acyl-CoA dehydrogenase family protein [Kyrpidia tusciae]|uniref:Acyl-CoA dehydrogenase n=1 Tax=Kyrpidia tusciae (strain DSM 2912 / NBRC 15312 / T2) TaxID=562970 RepID=D5WQ20_KYRT2|nr:acyl-CoA dehydrogenase family protein [Kyrpidia tusciae]ADG06429.1 acyl-CoA dehydrogenase domain protein [Kyrpidia tusciae DSM 2912]
MEHWLFTKEHEQFRTAVRRWVEKEIAPRVEEWEREGRVPREMYRRAGELGYLGLKFPEAYGGSDDLLADAIFVEEIARCGSGGAAAALTATTGIGATPIWRFGNEEQKRRYLVPAIRGEKIAALGVTEPDAGSDVASMRTVARREGDHYVLTGSKMFITGGASADYVCVAAKTDPSAGHRGVSMFIVEAGMPGFSVGRTLRKLGWRASDTAELILDGVQVPAENLVGEENQGFRYIMINFQWERIMLALSSVAAAEKALEDALRYSRERTQFGRPIGTFQALRHKMVDMAVDIEKARSLTYRALYLYARGEDVTVAASMAKAYAGEMVNRVTDAALQIHGGNGYMMEYPVQRYWRDARIMSIGGGTTQIMYEILTKRLGIV